MAIASLALLAPPTRGRAADPIELAPVVVTGTRNAQKADDSPVAVEVIDRAHIEATGARTAAEAIDATVGISTRGTFRGTGVEVQGLSTKHVLVLIDGQRVTGKVDEELDLSRFPAEAIERIEIVKGATSALYGSDAIGGVIHIITRRPPRDGTRGEIEITAGEHDRAVLTGRVAHGDRTFGATLAFGLHHDAPWRLDPSTPQTSGSGRDDIGTTLTLAWRPSTRFKLDTRVQHLYREQVALDATRLPDGLDGQTRFRRVDRRDHLHTLQARVAPTFRLGDGHALELAASTSLAIATLIQEQRGGTQYDRRQDSTEALASLEGEWSWSPSDAHALTAGVELHYETLDSERVSVATPDRARVAVFAQDVWHLVADPRLTIVPGLRLDVDSQFGAALAPRVALRVDPWPALTARLGFGLGVRAPGFRELYLTFDNASVGYRIEGNPALDPERSRSWQLGLDLRPADGWTITLEGFRHDVDGLITYGLLPAGETLDVYTYVNVDSATSQGLEASLTFAPSRELSVSLGYGLTDSRDDATDLRILGRATHQLTTRVSAQLVERLTLSASAELMGPRPFEDAAGARFDSDWQLIADARLAARLADHLELVVGCDNLADAGDATTLPIRPRTFYGGVRGRL